MEGDFDDEPFIYRLNDNGSGPSLLVKVFTERGWRLYQGSGAAGDDNWNLWWRTGAFPATCYNALGDWQFMNHIPKGGSICRKDNLSRLLRCMRKIYGSIYDFSPTSFHLPLEYAKLVSECSRLRRSAEEGGGGSVVWIHKPVAQSQGRGIFLFRSICEMRCGSAAVVQRYIERPLLIAGYKFDLRLYVCVPAYRPLTAYLYAEGLARFGTDKYTLSDIHNPYRHLTNSSLNKSGPRYAECKDMIGNGCKWTLKQIRRALVCRWGAREWLAWQRVRALVALTLLAQVAGTPPSTNCFEFYGFDVLLDDALKPWLLEVNLSPALASDCEADVAVKRPMLHDLFDLIGLPLKNTGLSTLQTPQGFGTNSGSDDESGLSPSSCAAPKPAMRLPTIAKVARHETRRRLVRHRKRQTIPLHCVNIKAPVPDKFLELREINGNPVAESKAEFEDKIPVSAIHTNDSPTEEVWRHSTVPTVTRRRGSPASLAWGNGIQWDKAPPRVGNWVRIFPFDLSSEDQSDDVREGVSQVSRFSRASREVVRDCERELRDSRHEERDARFLAILRSKLGYGSNFEVWIPPY